MVSGETGISRNTQDTALKKISFISNEKQDTNPEHPTTVTSLEEIINPTANSNATANIHIRNSQNFTSELLTVLRRNNCNIDDTAVDDIKAIVTDNPIEELNISCNCFTASGVVQILNALSLPKRLKILDISNNFKDNSSSGMIQQLSITLAKCHLLQQLNISGNSLTFNDVLIIAQALKHLSDLKKIDMSNNITSFYLECEFLIDVILSVNQSLIEVNVCGRNIRPRFNNNCMFSPSHCNENSQRFALQNLYYTDTALMNGHYQAKHASTDGCNQHPPMEYIKIEEKCPFSDKIYYYYVDHTGGTFYNYDHDFAIVIPPGAISEGKYLQIQAAASRFRSDGCLYGYHGYPISSHFWLGHYEFEIPVYLIMRHNAVIRNSEDIKALCLLRACVNDSTSNNIMEVVKNGVHFDYNIGYCVFTTNHFCSICLESNLTYLPSNKFSAYLYTYGKDKKDEYIAEVCFCPALTECVKVI